MVPTQILTDNYLQFQKPIKILLVDDEIDILDFLGYSLAKEGYNIITANDGRDAIRKAIKERPDLIVLDILMPECDGIRVCDRIKKCRRTQNSVIIFLTAGSRQFAKHAQEIAHADDFVLKPVRPNVFTTHIRGLLHQYGKIRSDLRMVIQVGGVVLNRITKEITTPQRHLKLMESEFEIIWLLASYPGKVLSLSDIRKALNLNEPHDPSPIKKYILRLREKIGEDYLKISTGFGYKFEAE